MLRTEPPSLAKWMLEHLATGNRNEEFARALLREFRAGRSDGWYWRQALRACAVAWLKCLRGRAGLLLFALSWSMLAPGCTAYLDRVENNATVLGETWQMDWPFSSLSRFGTWLILSLVFIWIGMLLYLLLQRRFTRSLSAWTIVQAFGTRVFLFLPIYFATFVVMNLLAYPGPVVPRSTMTPLGAIFDFRAWAVILRVPYLITTVFALWKVSSQFTATRPPAPATELQVSRPTADESSAMRTMDLYSVKRFLAFVVAAGLLNAMIGAFLLCRLPDSHAPTLTSLLMRAVAYVSVGILAGAAGTWFYWNRSSSPFCENQTLPFASFALACAAGWAWVPPLAILSDENSPAAPFAAMIGAFALFAGLRTVTSVIFVPSVDPSPSTGPEEPELFAESLYRAPREAHGYVIALCLYAGAWALIGHSIFIATALFALSAPLFAWKKTFVRPHTFSRSTVHRQATMKLVRAGIPAVLVTIWALLDGVAHRNHSAQMAAALAADSSSVSENSRSKSQRSRNGLDGYESIILWPIPQKKQIIPPLPTQTSLLAPGTSRPVVIRFDGPYWYIQPPDQRPGPTAHQAHGSPLAVNIKAENFIPLTMEAHQTLSNSIRLSRCREIRVDIESLDNEPGEVTMAILLSDSAAVGKPKLTLGQQSVVSNDPGRLYFRTAPVFKTLQFSVPAHASIRKFDEIIIELTPDVEHALVAPKVAIQQFQLLPR